MVFKVFIPTLRFYDKDFMKSLHYNFIGKIFDIIKTKISRIRPKALYVIWTGRSIYLYFCKG